MAQEPKRRHSKARKRTRRAAIMLKSIGIIACKNCGKPTIPHIVCKECGFYGGKKNREANTKVQVVKA